MPSDSLQTVMANLMFVVNEYRSHQAREDLIDSLKKQIDSKQTLVSNIEEHLKNAKDEITLVIAASENVMEMDEEPITFTVEQERNNELERILDREMAQFL